ncbi:MAG: ATP-binding protein, partial [Nannocystaceae bacterium]
TLVQQNKNTLKVDCHNVGEMQTDATRLRQILLNLLSNAAKFTYRGDIHLGAHLDDGNIVFTVRDTGIGISEEALTRIFEAFEQADNTTTRQYEGSGLGLTLCRRFSKSLGGAIEVVSAPGKGSTFTVTLPVGSPQDASHEQRI